jgi:MFS transporter, DHA1 family, inner membrane transport protein
MTQRRSVGALLGLAGGTFSYTTAEALPVGLLLPMAADLDISPSQVGSLITVYAAVVVVASIPLAILARRVPRRFLLSALLTGFVIGNLVCAIAPSLEVLIAARMATAATHALFWAVVLPAAAELFSPETRGRAVSVVFAGGNIALLIGVPAGTWLGEFAGWRAGFVAVAALGAIVLLLVATMLPTSSPDEGHSARGSEPNARRFWLLVGVAILTTTGAIVGYTYVALFVTEISAIPGDAVGAVLMARGVAAVAGILLVGLIIDRRPWFALIATIALQALTLLALFVLGDHPVASVVLVALAGFGFAGFTACLGGLVLRVAPGRSDVAGATLSASVNIGIAAGAFAGGLALPAFGVASTVLLGAAASALALALVLGERAVASTRERSPQP